MKCEQVRAAASATMDGETTPAPARQVADHLRRCPACTEWVRQAEVVSRQARVSAAPPANDLTERILAIAHQAPRRQLPKDVAVRVSLVFIAALQLAVTVPVLVLGHDREAPMHVAHEMGSFDAALALGLLAAAWRPSRASGMLPLVGAMALLLCVTAGVDLAAGRTSVTDEAPHLLCVAGWLLLYRLAVVSRTAPADPAAGRSVTPATVTALDAATSRFAQQRDSGGPAANVGHEAYRWSAHAGNSA